MIKDSAVKVVILTFGHLSRSSRLESGFHGEPLAPAVSGATADVEVLFYPSCESPIGVGKVVACTLSAEPLTQEIEQRSQIGAGRFFVLLPFRLDCGLEFVFAELG